MFRQSPTHVISQPPVILSGAKDPVGILRRFRLLRMTFVLISASFLLFPNQAYAKRQLPSVTSGKVTTKPAVGGVTAKVKFRADRRAVILNLSNLGAAKSVNYELQYETNGLMQGAGGSVTIEGNSQSREILFGSCSSGVCNYDKNIKNAKLTVTTTLKNGKKIVKPFKLKV